MDYGCHREKDFCDRHAMIVLRAGYKNKNCQPKLTAFGKFTNPHFYFLAKNSFTLSLCTMASLKV
jgi:hypothetical protein